MAGQIYDVIGIELERMTASGAHGKGGEVGQARDSGRARHGGSERP